MNILIISINLFFYLVNMEFQFLKFKYYYLSKYHLKIKLFILIQVYCKLFQYLKTLHPAI